jgi:hypothetical protein
MEAKPPQERDVDSPLPAADPDGVSVSESEPSGLPAIAIGCVALALAGVTFGVAVIFGIMGIDNPQADPPRLGPVFEILVAIGLGFFLVGGIVRITSGRRR